MSKLQTLKKVSHIKLVPLSRVKCTGYISVRGVVGAIEIRATGRHRPLRVLALSDAIIRDLELKPSIISKTSTYSPNSILEPSHSTMNHNLGHSSSLDAGKRTRILNRP